ncbi:tail fiber protein [Flavobacterium sp. N1736]|uniref:tail fiber protein n=1 Tax=Flavobacterium sp. N1736 TaxID=2986823 RepID=UPI0022255DC4|nr:tail fiber protein [Flavobacterium sp. N1736]
MKKLISLTLVFFCISISSKAQNTTFNNVSIGTDNPAYGIKIKANFPGVTGGWARGFYVTNENDTQKYISLGSLGSTTNGVATVTNSFIGTDYNNQYMTFLPNKNIGIGASNPQNVLQIGDFVNNLNYKISLPGSYNFEEIKLGQYGNGRTGLEMITHTNTASSFGVRLFAGTDTGMDGLQIQTADPSNSAAGLTYTTRLAVILNGNVGIGTIVPDEKLTVKGKIHTQEVRVDMAGPLVPDYVFANDYKLKSLQEVEDYIKENKHLPEIPSAQEIEKNGLMLAEMNMSLLKKMEEMTLYMIEMKKENEKQNKEIKILKSKLSK